MTTITLAGGCFWCFDAIFQQLQGVTASIAGYAGGAAEDATYAKVATARTGHAESVQVTFDENVLPTNVVLDMFFVLHDPTTPDRQGADVGSQYRSALFYENNQQKAQFAAARARAETLWDNPIVTEITPLDTFYPAELGHQNYFANNPTNPYCAIIITPKMSKVRQNFSKYMKTESA